MKFKRGKELKKLNEALGNGKIKIIAGLRQVGKSHLLSKIFLPYLKKNCQIKSNDIFYLELQYIHTKIRSSTILKKKIISKYNKHKFKYLIIDEVQLAGDGYDDVIKEFHNLHKKVDIIITGSNSGALSRDLIKKYKEDRCVIKVEPLSYSEIAAKKKKFTVDDYLNYGGIPRVLNSKDKNKEIESLYDELYVADLSDRNEYECLSEDKMKRILTFVYSTTSPVSEKSLTKRIVKGLGFNKIDKAKLNKEIGNFLDWCENAYLFYKFENDTYENNSKNPTIDRKLKYYCVDNGILNINFDGDDREAKLLENAIYLELRNLGIESRGYVINSNGRNGEIDFTFEFRGQKYYLQVTHTLLDSNKDREIGNLLESEISGRKILIYKNNLIEDKDDSIEFYEIEYFVKNIRKILK